MRVPGSIDGRLFRSARSSARVEIRPPVDELAGVVAVADDAGGVREKLRDGRARDRRMQAVDIIAGRIVELELALLAQLHDAGGGEAFGMRGDAEAMARGQLFAGREIGVPNARSNTTLPRCAIATMQPGCCEALHLEFEPARDVVECGG